MARSLNATLIFSFFFSCSLWAVSISSTSLIRRSPLGMEVQIVYFPLKSCSHFCPLKVEKSRGWVPLLHSKSPECSGRPGYSWPLLRMSRERRILLSVDSCL